MIKIGILGTACCGKTTLCYEILAALKKAGVKCDGVLQQDCRLGFDRSLLDTDPMAQWSIICNQIKVEADMSMRTGIDVLICDRTPLDLYVYFEHCFGKVPSLAQTVTHWCQTTYTKMYMLQPLPFEESPERCDEYFRDVMHLQMLKAVSMYPPSSNLEVEPDDTMEIRQRWREGIIERILLDGLRR